MKIKKDISEQYAKEYKKKEEERKKQEEEKKRKNLIWSEKLLFSFFTMAMGTGSLVLDVGKRTNTEDNEAVKIAKDGKPYSGSFQDGSVNEVRTTIKIAKPDSKESTILVWNSKPSPWQ